MCNYDKIALFFVAKLDQVVPSIGQKRNIWISLKIYSRPEDNLQQTDGVRVIGREMQSWGSARGG